MADLEFLKQQFTYLIERDVVTADKIAEAATFINDLRSCESEDEIMISCEDKLNEIKD